MTKKTSKKPSLHTIKENNNKKQKGRFTLSTKRNNGPNNGEKVVVIEKNIKLVAQIDRLRNENLRLKRNLCKIRALLNDVTC